MMRLYEAFSDVNSIEDPFAEDDWEAWSYFFKTSNFQVRWSFTHFRRTLLTSYRSLAMISP